jgi:hypothetical protein
MTVRAKREMALAVLDDDRSVKAVGAAYGCTWNTCHDAGIATADPALAAEPEGVTVLGIDETRRGKAKWENCSKTGVRRWVDRWDTGLVDITGAGGLLVQVNGRAAKPVTDWLDNREEAWKANIEFVAIDMSATYVKAAGRSIDQLKPANGSACSRPPVRRPRWASAIQFNSDKSSSSTATRVNAPLTRGNVLESPDKG